MPDGQTPPNPPSHGSFGTAHAQRIWTADRLDVRLRQRRIGPPQIRGLAAALAALYAEPVGAAPAARAVERKNRVRELCAALRVLAPELRTVDERERDWLAELERCAPALDARAGVPGPQRLHGALRSDRIYLDPAGAAVVEPARQAEFRVGDPAEDVAALLVELAADDEPGFAQRLLAAYAEASCDFAVYPVIGVHAALAALEAARSTLEAAIGAEPARRRAACASAERLLEAPRRLAPGRWPPRVLAFGGILASGKSTLSARLATRLGAPRISADALREALAQRKAERGAARLVGFEDAVTDEIYAAVFRAASAVLASGRTVVIDATFPTRALRAQLCRFAADLGVALRFVECQADLAVVRRRLAARARTQHRDAQEWLALLDRFLGDWEPIEELTRSQHLAIDTTRDPKACLERVERWLGSRSGPLRVSPPPAWAQTSP
jgi:predicted kinase